MTARRFIVAGTDTGVGKTVFAAALAAALDGVYWKPVQAGLDGETDSETVRRLSGLPGHRIIPEAYRLRTPASPHIAAARDGVTIARERLEAPETDRPLVIEGAGGLLAPLAHAMLSIDVFPLWRAPVVLCARTSLGTINHSLLSLEALARRAIPVHGVAFAGDENLEVERTIAGMGRARRLGRLPFLDPLNRETLSAAFRAQFDMGDFMQGALGRRP